MKMTLKECREKYPKAIWIKAYENDYPCLLECYLQDSDEKPAYYFSSFGDTRSISKGRSWVEAQEVYMDKKDIPIGWTSKDSQDLIEGSDVVNFKDYEGGLFIPKKEKAKKSLTKLYEK